MKKFSFKSTNKDENWIISEKNMQKDVKRRNRKGMYSKIYEKVAENVENIGDGDE